MVLETAKLMVRFGGLVAVNGVDMTLRQGEVRGLIGPNGSGKTTFINLVTGIYQPTGGKVHLLGEDITAMSPDKITSRGLMRTFQLPRVFGNMTLLENMLVPRFADIHRDYRRQLPGAIEKADGLLAAVDLRRLRDEQAKTLSGGQKALLQLARGLMPEHVAAFMLDEPFAGVNMVIKETMMRLISEKAAEGVAFLLVSHEMTSIRTMCPTVTVLAEGSIIAEGTMDAIASMDHVIEAYLVG